MANQVSGECVDEILDLYQFDNIQKDNFISLLHLSDPDTEFIERYCTKQDLSNTLKYIIDITQKKFYGRSNGQERWEATIPDWITLNLESVLKYSSNYGLFNETKPQSRHYGCAAILGATAPTMECRISYMLDLMDRGISFDHIYVVTGERVLDMSKLHVEGGVEYINNVAIDANKSVEELTEFDLAQDKAKIIKEKHPEFDIMYINAPGPRPNTISTVKMFLQNDVVIKDCKSYLFISNAPSTISQLATIKNIMQSNSINIPYEVVGAKKDIPDELTKKQRTAFNALGELAGSMFRKREEISSEIEKKQEQCKK